VLKLAIVPASCPGSKKKREKKRRRRRRRRRRKSKHGAWIWTVGRTILPVHNAIFCPNLSHSLPSLFSQLGEDTYRPATRTSSFDTYSALLSVVALCATHIFGLPSSIYILLNSTGSGPSNHRITSSRYPLHCW
jgi:hypothetical protein